MPYSDYIGKLLDLEGLNVEEIKNLPDRIEIHFSFVRKPHTCPQCGALTEAVHDYRTQTVKDSPIQGKFFIWKYRKRRYICSCGKRFYEACYLLPKGHRITSRTAALALHALRQKRSQRDVASDLNVSASTIGRWMQHIQYPKPKKLPAVLSIDEFKGNTDRGKYQCILTSPEDKAIVDILPTYYSSSIYEYLRAFPNRNEIKYFVMDMRKPYLEIAQSLFPNATVVIDRFHVVRYCVWALENVRKREQLKLSAVDRKYFKRSRKLLTTRMSRLSDENKLAVERMLVFSRDLREAYLLKEAFFKFIDSPSKDDAKKNLLAFRLYAQIAQIPEFDACCTMLFNWEPYIMNAFGCSYSNGFTEGINNYIKVVKRIGFGFRNFDNFRRRIMFCTNTYG